MQILYNSALYLGLGFRGLILLIADLLKNAFLYEKDVFQVNSKVNKKGSLT